MGHMGINRRTFLSLVARLWPAKLLLVPNARARSVAANGQSVVKADAGDALCFLMVGDWGRQGLFHQRDVAAQMRQVAGQLRCPFIVSVGDNFYENGVSSLNDPQWRASFEAVYAAPALQVPWYCVLGNHDYQGRPQAQLDYALQHPRWRMPARYYSARECLPDGGAVRFFFLDTSPFVTAYGYWPPMAAEVRSQDTAAQLRWLDQGLGTSPEPWKIVVGHHPIFSGGEHGTQPELVDRLLPLLRQHGVQVYVNGHDHDLQHLVRDGIHFFGTGAGSQVRAPHPIQGTHFAQGVPGFLAVALTEARFQGTFFDAAGTLLHEADVPRSNA